VTAAQERRERLPSCRLLIITSLANPAALRRAMAAQVDGYVLKDTSPDELVCAIRKVAAGQRVIDPQLALAAWEGPTEELTPRERTVLSLTARGDEVGEIAAELHLSNGTVRNYQTAIIQKLGARNRVDAIRIAREAGLT
jgi:two-component system response regulator DesR